MSTSSSTTTPKSAGPSTRFTRLLVLGGGAAGLAVLDALRDSSLLAGTTLIEPSEHHYDQPSWMRVGTEGMKKEHTRSAQEAEIPDEVTWIQDRATRIDPGSRVVDTADGARIEYEYLLIALGTTPHWDRIQGLEAHLGRHGICSVYGYEQAEQAWDLIKNFDGGRALFTAPSTPFKGGSAPLHVLRRAEALWRATGVREKTELFFTTAARSEIAGDAYSELIERGAAEQDIHVYSGYELRTVRPERREAVFSVRKGKARSEDVLGYDLLHVVPPMRPPALLEESGLAHQDGPMKGYLAVDPESLRHRRFDIIFGLGDAVGVEGVKTREQAREQATQVARTLRRLLTTA
jgi:sulfide:quinone oxidoreductase